MSGRVIPTHASRLTPSAFFQGGFIPDNILYLSYWYNSYDLPIRMALFYTINPLSDMITSFLAVGLLQMRGILGYAGWRWMFLIEGLFTLLIGGMSPTTVLLCHPCLQQSPPSG